MQKLLGCDWLCLGYIPSLDQLQYLEYGVLGQDHESTLWTLPVISTTWRVGEGIFPKEKECHEQKKKKDKKGDSERSDKKRSVSLGGTWHLS